MTTANRFFCSLNRRDKFIDWDSQPLAPWIRSDCGGETITLGGWQTHYQALGEGPAVILIHGFFFDHTCWQRNIEVLARRYRVYALDLWGFGYSTRDPLPYSYPLFAAQLLAFMDRLNIDRAALVGQSLGGGVAIEFSVRHPDRVSQLVLVDAAGMPNPEPFTARMFMLRGVGEALLRLPVDSIRRRMLDDFFLYDPGSVTPALFQDLVRSQKIRGTIAAALALMRLRFADKLEAGIQQLAGRPIPTLIVWGEHDRAILPQIGLKMHALLPDSEFASIPSAGHVPNLEQPETFNRLLLEFIC